jgi:hypothetical protein
MQIVTAWKNNDPLSQHYGKVQAALWLHTSQLKEINRASCAIAYLKGIVFVFDDTEREPLVKARDYMRQIEQTGHRNDVEHITD